MKIEIFKDHAHEWRWHIIADNGNIVADSGEGYKNRLDCIIELEMIWNFAKSTPLNIEERTI